MTRQTLIYIYFAYAFSLFSLASMSTSTSSTIEMNDILTVEEGQQSAQLRDPILPKQTAFQRFSQAVNFNTTNSQDSTEKFRISDLEKYLNDASRASEVSFIHI